MQLSRLQSRARWATSSAILSYVLTMFGIGWIVVHGAETSGYTWQWYRVPRFLLLADGAPGPLLRGAGTTLVISALSLVGASIIAMGTALMRLSESMLGRAVATVYLELIRDTPLLVQIFFMYFVLAPILDIDRMASAVLALSLFEGAYASEIIRAGILAVPRGQWEGALSLGMGTSAVYRQVILPQALRDSLPPLTSQGISLIKDSALVSTIAIFDLTMQGQAIVAETFLSFEIWFTVAGLYLLVTWSLSGLARRLETVRRI